jgi:hypothetical protein
VIIGKEVGKKREAFKRMKSKSKQRRNRNKEKEGKE